MEKMNWTSVKKQKPRNLPAINVLDSSQNGGGNTDGEQGKARDPTPKSGFNITEGGASVRPEAGEMNLR